MKNNDARLKELFPLYLDNRLTREQFAEFWELLNGQPDERILIDELTELWQTAELVYVPVPAEEWNDKMKRLKGIIDETAKDPVKKRSISLPAKYRWAAAAAVLVAAFTVIMYSKSGDKKSTTFTAGSKENRSRAVDVSPGKDRAVLTLADGSQVVLDSTGDGMVIQQGGTTVMKQDGRLIYSPVKTTNAGPARNTLSTPAGGQYRLTLPDGTKLWLNAASSLKYPTAFTGNERRVEIAGEAYFEVAKNPSRPFIVSVVTPSGEPRNLEVEVLGTHFNINSYEDEETVNTTLVEGSIKIKSKKYSGLVRPGQQAQMNKAGTIRMVNDMDASGAIAWKEGNFQFDNANIGSVMRQLARWYNIEVEFKGEIDKHFGGTISRNVSLSKVLNLLEKTGEVKFIIEDKRVQVYQ